MIFEIFSVRVKLCFSFAAAVTMMLLFARTQTALLSLLSSIAHETGHILCLFLFGQKPDKITLGFFGMRMECAGERRLSYGRDAFFLLGGVLVNGLLAAVSRAFFFTGSTTVRTFCAINVAIALFNLLPMEPLDGGRALHILLCRRMPEKKSAKALLIISYLTVAFLVVLGIYLYVNRRLSLSFAAVTVYLIIQTTVYAGEKDCRR